jgi:dTDP-4-dehydrorhamnose reductase
MRILITGGSGLLGQYLNIELSKNHSILTLYHQNIRNCIDYNCTQTDINDKIEVSEIFKSFRPEVVVHTAAVTNPSAASQMDPRLVYNTNVNATSNIAELCLKGNARLVYMSTDLVYAGYRGSMLTENAKLIPTSFYAETKLMGEVKIKEVLANYLTLRAALFYGFGLNKKYNHFHQMYLNLKDKIPVKLFQDQFRTPIELGNAAAIINQLIEKGITNETINLGGKERVSRYQLGELLCDTAGFDKTLLQKISMDDMPDLPKVEDVSMDTNKLQSYGIQQDNIEEAIKKIIFKR